MRKEFYLALGSALKEVGDGAIKYVDLWNHNVEFIEQEDAWERPAVFVEFGRIIWDSLMGGLEWRGRCEVRLHVVTDWKGSSNYDSENLEESLSVFDLLKEIQLKVTGMSGETFCNVRFIASDTNHNHEDIVENIEVYGVTCIRKLE